MSSAGVRGLQAPSPAPVGGSLEANTHFSARLQGALFYVFRYCDTIQKAMKKAAQSPHSWPPS